MTTRPDTVTASQLDIGRDEPDGWTSPELLQLEIAVLECRIAALERELQAERERNQAIITRYERLLDDR